MTDLTTTPDRQLADWLFYDDVRRAELSEVDGLYCYDREDDDREGIEHDETACSHCRAQIADADERRAVEAEIERRIENDIRVDDPNAETLEERWAPFGTEWQLEQRERQEGR